VHSNSNQFIFTFDVSPCSRQQELMLLLDPVALDGRSFPSDLRTNYISFVDEMKTGGFNSAWGTDSTCVDAWNGTALQVDPETAGDVVRLQRAKRGAVHRSDEGSPNRDAQRRKRRRRTQELKLYFFFLIESRTKL
jgi:hypothetical protein